MYSSSYVRVFDPQNLFGRQEPTNGRVAAPDLMKLHTLLNNSLLITSSKRDQSQGGGEGFPLPILLLPVASTLYVNLLFIFQTVVPNLDCPAAATETTRTSFTLAIKGAPLAVFDFFYSFLSYLITSASLISVFLLFRVSAERVTFAAKDIRFSQTPVS